MKPSIKRMRSRALAAFVALSAAPALKSDWVTTPRRWKAARRFLG